MSGPPITPNTHYVIRVFTITTPILVTVALALVSTRIGVRIRRGQKLRVDDWLIVAAWVSPCLLLLKDILTGDRLLLVSRGRWK